MKNIPLAVPSIGDKELNSVEEVLNSGWLAPGEYNKKFEQQFKDLLGVKYAITMNSCASALEISLKASGVDKGEVIIPSFTFVATANAVVNSGATPVFCDVDINTRNTTLDYIKKVLTDKTKAVIVVHFGGQPAPIVEIAEFCKENNILLIEDSAETLGATWEGKQAGSFGIGCFSFFPTKNIATGEGGMLVCNDDQVAKNAKALIGHGIVSSTFERENLQIPWYREAVLAGHNYRMSNILAALGYNQMQKLEQMNNKRQKLAEYYNSLINSNFTDFRTPFVHARATHVYQMYTILVPEKIRDSFVLKLRENGIGASVHFDPPVHLQKYYKDNFPARIALNNTEELARSIVTLPMYPDMEFEDIDYIIETMKKVL